MNAAEAAQGLEEIQRQLIWNRLIGIVEEQAQTLIRTAFSQSVRESGDLSAGVFDRRGRMAAQAITGTPGHVNSMAVCVVEFLKRYPIDGMKPGDVYITNDPWLSVGHYHDVTVVTPAFRAGRPIALFANTIHIVDMGGRGFGPDGRQCYEEGINIPIMKLAREGSLNEDLLEILRTNVRQPLHMEGDIHSQMAANGEAVKRLDAMLEEFGHQDIETISDYIVDASRAAVERKIAQLPKGTWRAELVLDGYDTPIPLCAALTIGEREIHVDYAGTAPACPYGINVVLNFSTAYSVFGVNCIVAPDVPCNAGSLAPIRVSAPLGSILNVERPYPVSARHSVGQMLPDLMFACLAQAIPQQVPAQGAGTMWNPMLRGGRSAIDPQVAAAAPRLTTDFDTLLFNTGGTGARPGLDGLNTVAFPSGVRTVPSEAVESAFPVIVWRKEWREGSGGAGEFRGGCGQVIELACEDDAPFAIAAMFERTRSPALGRDGGGDGAPGRLYLKSGPALASKGRHTIPHGDRLVLELPGGGGLGDPARRPAEKVAADVADGIVSAEEARARYRVVLDANGTLDAAATARARA